MNRLELSEQIKKEGKKRGIIVTRCSIYDRSYGPFGKGENILDFYLTIENEYASRWVYKHQVRELVDDLAPLERPHKVEKIDIESRKFEIGDNVEVENLWIRLDAGEKDPSEDLIKIGSHCGQYRGGWVRGEVFETPEQNDRALGIKFPIDIYLNKAEKWIGDVYNLENMIRNGDIQKIEKGQPIWCGTAIWQIRKP